MLETIEKTSMLDDGAMDAQLHQLFSTPVLEYQWPRFERLNEDLRDRVMHEAQASSGRLISNRGGWRSENKIQDWEDTCIQILLARIHQLLDSLIDRLWPDADQRHHEGWNIEAWANVNSFGAYNASHNHAANENVWSGIYYVDVGSRDDGGPLGGKTTFEDRARIPIERITNADVFRRELVIEPENGKMVLFPGQLYHRVPPYEGSGSRITIAFNLRHPGGHSSALLRHGAAELAVDLFPRTDDRDEVRPKQATQNHSYQVRTKKLKSPFIAGIITDQRVSGMGRERPLKDKKKSNS